MNYRYFLFILAFTIVSCYKSENLNKRIRLKKIELIELNEPNNLYLWDSINGPDLYITISINNVVKFTSDSSENRDILKAPIIFKLDSSIIFYSITDDLTLSMYDHDDGENQLIINNIYIKPALFNVSTYTELISCADCFGTFKLTFEKID